MAALTAQRAAAATLLGGSVHWPASSVAPRAAAPELLAAVRSATYGLEVVAAQAGAAGRARALAVLATLRPREEQLQALAGADAGAPPLGYRLPFAVTTPASAARLARALFPDLLLSVGSAYGAAPETARGWSGWCAGRPSCRPRPGPGARHRRRSPGSPRREHAAGDGRGRRTGVVRGPLRGRPAEGFQTGDAWLDRLPGLVRTSLQRWELTPDGPARHGVCALVLPVRRGGGEAAVLKVAWPHPEARHEHLALQLWGGHGAVRLLAADPATWTHAAGAAATPTAT